jgi:hypothetical protein
LPQPPTYQQPQTAAPYNQLPPHLQPYTQQPPPPGSGVVSPLPLGAPVQTPHPFLPYPSQPPTFTKQLTALEADEVPPHLRLDANRPNWLLRGLLALAIIGGGISAGLLLFRGRDDDAQASLLIDSIPHGATVLVDGAELKDPTPVVYPGTHAGARHTIELRMKGKKSWSDTIVVPAAGGEVQVKPFLQSLPVTLHVRSTPPGAEVYFNDDDDHPQGRTPLDLSNLDPSAVQKVTLKLSGYAPETRAVDFASSTEQTVDATLKK